LADIIDNLLHQVVLVSEDDVTLAIAEALRFQSLALEGSAAAAIAAYHQVASQLSGRVLLLLTGQNVSPSVLARSLVQDVSSDTMRRKMGLRNVFNPADRYNAPHPGQNLETTPPESSASSTISSSTDDSAVVLDDEPYNNKPKGSCDLNNLVKNLVDRLLSSIAEHNQLDDHRRAFSAEMQLRHDPWCQSAADELSARVQTLAHELREDLRIANLPYWIAEERYRLLLQLQSAHGCLFERASPSYDQAMTEWFADTASQNSAMVNYDRYGALRLRRAEAMLLEAMRPQEKLDGGGLVLLLASSGMAAFQIVLHYIMERLEPTDTVLLPGYIYFEASEQLHSLSRNGAFKVQSCESYLARDLVAAAEACDARVVCIDPVANVAGLPTTDIREYARLVCSTPGWERRTVVIDGTMISGGLPVYDWFVGPHAPLVLYVESASKYAQLGLDVQMGGVVVVPTTIEADMRKIRRDVGAVMYSRGVSLLPLVDFDGYQSRLHEMTRNAEALRTALSAAISPELARVAFPTEWKAHGWRHGGVVVTLEFVEPGLNQREGLEACIGLMLSEAQQEQLPLTKGVSFGFSTSRVSASSSMAEGLDPFLRVSVGVEAQEIETLAEVVSRAVNSYASAFGR
jgi:cystathionine beta-lyase/cystathionine gamma-synthase